MSDPGSLERINGAGAGLVVADLERALSRERFPHRTPAPIEVYQARLERQYARSRSSVLLGRSKEGRAIARASICHVGGGEASVCVYVAEDARKGGWGRRLFAGIAYLATVSRVTILNCRTWSNLPVGEVLLGKLKGRPQQALEVVDVAATCGPRSEGQRNYELEILDSRELSESRLTEIALLRHSIVAKHRTRRVPSLANCVKDFADHLDRLAEDNTRLYLICALDAAKCVAYSAYEWNEDASDLLIHVELAVSEATRMRGLAWDLIEARRELLEFVPGVAVVRHRRLVKSAFDRRSSSKLKNNLIGDHVETIWRVPVEGVHSYCNSVGFSYASVPKPFKGRHSR